MVGIQATILLAISEYAVILVLKRSTTFKKNAIRVKKREEEGAEEYEVDQLEQDEVVQLKRIDEMTTMGSAIFFLLFNTCYWIAAKYH